MARIVPDVAVVTYNADHYVLRLLTTLAPLCAAGEIGVVHVWDNASTDRTGDVLAILAAQYSWLRTHAAARNVHHGPALDALLRDHCQAEWVLALDADTEVSQPFGCSLDTLDLEGAAFVGQIQPYESQLYAYLAHLLIHRPRYFALPPFRDHGAPGIDYFRGVDARGERFVRFRWCDYIRHVGQGSLRRLVERADRGNKFYDFARREAEAHPKSPDRLAHDRSLEAALELTLDAHVHTPRQPRREVRQPSSHRAAASIVADLNRHRARRSNRSRNVRDSVANAYATLRSPRVSSWLRAARRLGLVQQPREVMALLALLAPTRPSCMLEIGTAYGGSLSLWPRVATRDALIVSVDLPQWELDDPGDVAVCERLQRVGAPTQRVRLVRGSSHDAAVRERVSQLVDRRSLDFLFIDGDHTYSGVAQDFRDYAPFVRRGGIIAFHDIHPHACGWGGEVPRFWREISGAYRHTELIAAREQHGFGIGVIWM